MVRPTPLSLPQAAIKIQFQIAIRERSGNSTFVPSSGPDLLFHLLKICLIPFKEAAVFAASGFDNGMQLPASICVRIGLDFPLSAATEQGSCCSNSREKDCKNQAI